MPSFKEFIVRIDHYIEGVLSELVVLTIILKVTLKEMTVILRCMDVI